MWLIYLHERDLIIPLLMSYANQAKLFPLILQRIFGAFIQGENPGIRPHDAATKSCKALPYY